MEIEIYSYSVYKNNEGTISIKQRWNEYGEDIVMFTPYQIDRLCEDLQKVKKEIMSEEQ